MKKRHIAALVIALTAITAYVAMRYFTTERQRVERVVRGILRRIEKRDAAGLCLHLAEDYKDNNGHNRASLRALLSRGLPYFSSIDVTASELETKIHEGEPKTATVEFDARIRAYRREHPNKWPGQARTRVRLHLRKKDGEWRVTEAEYRMPSWRL